MTKHNKLVLTIVLSIILPLDSFADDNQSNPLEKIEEWAKKWRRDCTRRIRV